MSLFHLPLTKMAVSIRRFSFVPAPFCRRCLGLFTAIGIVFAPVTGVAQPVRPPPALDTSTDTSLANFVAEAAERFAIPGAWIQAVLHAESAGQVRAVSAKGAKGLMQIMPQTWDDLRSRYGLGADPFDAHDNVMAGAAYLRELHDRYGDAGFLAAYNAGPERYETHLATGQPLPAETVEYVATVAGVLKGGGATTARMARGAVRPWTDAPLYPVQLTDTLAVQSKVIDGGAIAPRYVGGSAVGLGMPPRSDGLFVVRSNAGAPQ
jgi:hypothetical protein